MFYKKKHPHRFFKEILIVLQVLSLTFYSHIITAKSDETISNSQPPLSPLKYNQIKIKTAPISIETPSGPALAQIEVQAINIQTKDDLENARIELGLNIKKNPNTENLILMEVIEENAKTDTSLDDSTQIVIDELQNSIKSEKKTVFKPATVKLPDVKGFFKKNYNGTLAVVRFILNSTVITTELVSSKGVPLEYAAIVGLLVGAMSGAIQLKSAFVYKIISDSMFFVDMAKKSGLIKQTNDDTISTNEKVLREIVFYGKWSLMEYAFLSISQSAMEFYDISTNDNVLLTMLKTVASQGFFERGVIKVEAELKNSYPNSIGTATVFKNSALFLGSTISVLCAIGVFAGVPYANMGFVLLTGLGVVLNFKPGLSQLRKRQDYLDKIRSGATIITCRSLFH